MLYFPTALKFSLLSQSLIPTRVQSEVTKLIASPSSGNTILYEESTSDLARAEWNGATLNIDSVVPVTLQRFKQADQFGDFLLSSRSQRPLGPGDATLLVTSDCNTGETNVIPKVVWGKDANGEITSVKVTLPKNAGNTDSMTFLESSSFDVSWKYVFSCPFRPPPDTGGGKPPTPSSGEIPIEERTACLTEEECDAQRQQQAFTTFRSTSNGYPNIPAIGCFSKGGVAYFGEGGTVGDMSKSPLTGSKERIWCRAAVPAATPSPKPAGVRTACLTSEECDAQRQLDGFGSFRVGNYPVYGCFSKYGKAYFGKGGTDALMTKEKLAGDKERIWCDGISKMTDATEAPAASPVPVPVPSPAVCSTEEQCNKRRQELGFVKYYVGNYPSYGCFYKNDKAFFGEGGTAEQMTKDPVGINERIWCIESGGVQKSSTLASAAMADNPPPSGAFTSRRSIPLNVMISTVLVILLFSVVFPGRLGSAPNLGNVNHFYGFGMIAVAALAATSLVSKKSQPSSSPEKNNHPSLSTHSRSLQKCNFNLEIFIDACFRGFNITAPSGRLIDVVVQDFTYVDKVIDQSTTETLYNASFVFPEKKAIDLNTSSNAVTSVDGLEEDNSCYEIVCGRPFVDANGKSLLALPFMNPDVSWLGEVSDVVETNARQSPPTNSNNTSQKELLLLGKEWLQKALGEHASVASFAAFSIALMTNSAPSSLVEGALNAGLDEVRHAKTSFKIASKLLGKEVGPGPLPESNHAFSHNLTALAMAVAKEGCVDETLAAFIAGKEAEEIDQVILTGMGNTKYAAVADDSTLVWIRDELHVIAREERDHSALAWRTFSWVCSVDSDACNAVQKVIFDESALKKSFHRHLGRSLLEKPGMLDLMREYWDDVSKMRDHTPSNKNDSPVCSE